MLSSESLHQVWNIARHEYIINVRRTGFIVITAIVPLIMVAILGIAAVSGGQVGEFLERQFRRETGATGVVDQSGLFTPLLPEYRDDCVPYGDESQGRAALRAGEIDLLMVIPADYLTTGEVRLVSSESGASAAMTGDAQGGRAFYIDHLVHGKVDEAVRQRLVEPVKPVVVPLDGESEPNGGVLGLVANILVPYFLGLLLILTLLTSSGYLLRSVSEEKTTRVIEILLSSVTARELLAGKVVGLGAVGLTQVTIWLGSVLALSGGFTSVLGVAGLLFTDPTVLALAVVYYLLGFMVFAVLMGTAGAIGTSQQEAQQVAGLFSMLAALPMMFGGFLISNPNMIVARVLSWFPITAPITMLMRLGMARVPVIDIIGSIALLLLTVPLVLWAGAKVFRMGLLMYGKRASLAEAMQALRRA